MSLGQSDTLSYESIMGYYKSKTNMIEFYQMAGNNDKAAELTKERNEYIDALGNNYGKACFYYNLSLDVFYLSNYSEAIQLGTEAMQIFKIVLGMEHPYYATSLSSLAEYYSSFGNYSEAIRFGTEAMGIRKKVFGTEHPDYASSLNNLAIYFYRLGNYSEAIRFGTEAMEIFKKVLGTEHPNYAASLSNLANYNSSIGNYSEAIRYGTEAMKIRKKALGTEHPDYAMSLNNLANYNSNLGNYSEAIRLDTETMEIRKKVLGTEHPDYSMSLHNLARDYSFLGNYSEAIRLSTEAMENWKKALGTEHPSYATSLYDLAGYYSDLGNYSEAICLGTEALEIRKKVLGTEHPDYAASLNNLARNYSSLGNYSEAIRLYTEAMEILKKALGMEHPEYAVSLHNLARDYSSLGNYSEAIRLGTEAMENWKKVLGTEHPDYAMSLNNLACYYSSLGNYSEAIRLGTKAMEIRKKVLGTEHPDYATSLNNLACYYTYLGNYSEAWTCFKQGAEVSWAYILRSFSELSGGFRESLWNKDYAFKFNSFFPNIVFRYQTNETISELCNKTALFAKGILLNTGIAMRKQILESGDSVLVARYDALVANNSIYDKQLEKPIKERFLNTDSLRLVIQRQEMELARDSKTYGDFARNLRIKWQDVQQRLGKNDLAIEFLDFPLYGTDSTMYVALTLKKGYDNPHMITLFEKRQLKSISEDNYYTNTDLYNLIWKPLEEELSGVEKVYFSPSGDLHRIGIEYVPVTMIENMCDRYNLHRLSSTRQLAYIQDETKGDKSVLYGGLKYDAEVSDTIPASPSARENRGFTFVPRAIVDSLDIRGSYKYLPGTKEEADHIVSYLNTHSIPYKYYYGVAGTEESFKGLDGSKPKTLHIATHGFYMTEQDAERKNFARPLLQEETRVYHEDKPMTRSGLLLSGCSRALNHENIPDGIEDGILTADEISKLDLRGLDLVVLSACQTGLGDITSGEGVFGLQRGFKNAGAKTIIMSLWKVSDIATQHLMTSFYNHYLSGMPKEQSFRMAQKELREMIGPGQNKPDWAAFVMLDGI